MAPSKIGTKPSRAELKMIKVKSIFSSAMKLLNEGGIESLSMRAVSEDAGMSLSNLQYHFKTRDDLLVALLGDFLQEYIRESQVISDNGLQSNFSLKSFYFLLLTHESMDRCAIIFKEIWAYSHRSNRLNDAITEYYKNLHKLLCSVISQWDENAQITDKNIIKCVDVILPFFEGYCITKSSIQSDPKVISEDLEKISLTILNI